jgi:cellulose synthase (UDP-forming)
LNTWGGETAASISSLAWEQCSDQTLDRDRPFMVMLYAMFPAVLCATLAVLMGRYRLPDKIQATFVQAHRSRSLKTLHACALVLLPLSFVTLYVARAFFLRGYLRYLFASASGVHLAVNLLLFGVVTFCELVAATHTWIYIFYSNAGLNRPAREAVSPLARFPGVTVMIPCCDEPLAVLERSVASAAELVYPNVRVLLVENSRDPELKAGAMALAARYGIDAIDVPNRGHKAGALNDALRFVATDSEYIAVLDADQAVRPNFLAAIVPLLAAQPDLAFVQTPQVYVNATGALVGRAASQQQMLLYDCVLDGKSARGRAPCYGTNFVMRRSALESVGGWDEDNVTEDVATSYELHCRRWRSIYDREVFAEGLAPETLKSYWRQQVRWASGNSAVFRTVLRRTLARDARSPSWGTIVDYLWSAGFYPYTLVLTLLSAWPSAILVTDLLTGGKVAGVFRAASLRADVSLAYAALYCVYALTVLFPLANMRMRGYSLSNLLLVQGLMASTSPMLSGVVVKALLFGSRKDFQGSRIVGSSRALTLVPQVPMFLILLLTGSILGRYVWSDPTSYVMWVLLFWTFVHCLAIAHYFPLALQGTEEWEGRRVGAGVMDAESVSPESNGAG